MRAVVVFHGDSTHILAPLLKKGYAHVTLILESDQYWVLLDPGRGTFGVKVLTGSNVDIVTPCRKQGWSVIETEVKDIIALSPVVLNNCVGVVKKALGIRNPFIWTPYQLCKYLERRR